MAKNNPDLSAPEVSFGDDYFFGSHQHISLSSIYSNYICNPAAEHVEAIRDLREYVEKNIEIINASSSKSVEQKIRYLKAKLPLFTWSGTFDTSEGIPKNNTLIHHSGYLQVDIDWKDKPRIESEQLRDKLAKDPHIEAAFLSPTGLGVKCGLRIPLCIDDVSHKRAYFAAERYFKETYELDIDPNCKDVRRNCFLSFDPQLCINSHAIPLDIEKWPPAKKKQHLPIAITYQQPADEDLDKLLGRIEGYDDYDNWIRVGHAVKQHFGDAGYDSWAKWSSRSIKWDDAEEQENRKRWEGFNPTSIKGLEVLKQLANVSIGNFHRKPNRNGAPVLFPNTHNVLETLTLRKEPIWYDTFLRKIMTTLGDEKDNRPQEKEWADELNISLTIYFQNECEGWHMLSDNTVEKAVRSYADKHKRNCLVNWLDSLHLHWDGKTRLDNWLINYCGAKDDVYVQEAGRCWLLGAVSRAYSPGCKFDNCLILEGKQGIGKTTALEILSNGWVVQLKTFNDEKAIENIQGKWIIEIEELDAFNRSETETIKSFISARKDTYRVKYNKHSEDRLRTCVFAGTTNKNNYLQDETGARRFWPVWCNQIDLEALAKDRDQILAEAVHRYKEGESVLMNKEAAALALENQSARYQGHSWDEIISEYCEDKEEVTRQEIYEKVLGINPQQWDRGKDTTIGKIMSHLGRQRKQRRINGSKQSYYIRAS